MPPIFLAIANTNLSVNFIKRLVEQDNQLTIIMSPDDRPEVVPQAEETYVRAYMTEAEYFQVGSTYYNPELYVEVYIETEDSVETAFIVDRDGDVIRHTDPDEIQALRDAAPNFIWQPTPAPVE